MGVDAGEHVLDGAPEVFQGRCCHAGERLPDRSWRRPGGSDGTLKGLLTKLLTCRLSQRRPDRRPTLGKRGVPVTSCGSAFE